jgi:hypothetical protein
MQMYSHGLLLYFLALCLVIDAVVARVKAVSSVAGTFLSNYVFAKGLVDSRPLAGKIQMKKWQEQSWQLCIHVSMSLLELYILSTEDWWTDTITIWVPHPFEQRGMHRVDLQVLYITQLAVWIYTCFIHRFVDERRKDYFVMYTHHLVTIALVGMSWAVGYLRIGLLVLWIHDVSDIFVDLLKMVNYLKLEDKRGYFASEIAYVACVAGWFYWRLYQYPFKVLHAALVVPYTVLLKTPREAIQLLPALGLEIFPTDLPYHLESNALLFLLLGLHIYWFHLFVMIGFRILTESVREASRQEYEGDSDDDELEDGAAAGAGAGAGGEGEGDGAKSGRKAGSGTQARSRVGARKTETDGDDADGEGEEDRPASSSNGKGKKGR